MSNDKKESPSRTGNVLKVNVEYDEYEESLKANVFCPFCSTVCHSEKAIRLHLFNSHPGDIINYITTTNDRKYPYNLAIDWSEDWA